MYGKQRLVSPLDWANTRRTFEGVRLLTELSGWNVDLFLTEFVRLINMISMSGPIRRSMVSTALARSNPIRSCWISIVWQRNKPQRIGIHGELG